MNGPLDVQIRAGMWIPILALPFLATACRQSLVPIPTSTLSEAPTVAPQTPLATEALPSTAQASTPGLYAAVWIDGDEPLVVRQPAGITSMAVEALASDQRNLSVTGKTSQLGSSTWVEINLPQGGRGWVNGWNLTEDVARDEFCVDPRVQDLVNRFIMALQSRDGAQLAQLVSPKRGLIIRHDWWNPEVPISLSEVSGIFHDPATMTWGVNRDSELTIEGTFSDVMMPQLEDVFSVAPEIACNELVAGISGQEVIWPSEYSNLNYLAFNRPAPDPGSQLNWRTFGLGIEYVDGQPYLAVLVQYRGEI